MSPTISIYRWAIVQMQTSDQAQHIISNADGIEVDGRKLNVRLDQKQETVHVSPFLICCFPFLNLSYPLFMLSFPPPHPPPPDFVLLHVCFLDPCVPRENSSNDIKRSLVLSALLALPLPLLSAVVVVTLPLRVRPRTHPDFKWWFATW